MRRAGRPACDPVKLWVLGSGSAGNAVLVECGETRVLVDAGFASRTIAGRLASIGVAPASIAACLVTHEHSDHVKGAAAGARRWGWALYASAGTIAASAELQDAGCVAVADGMAVSLGRLSATTMATPHDAAGPVGVRLACTRTGATAVVCTDVGHASERVRQLCATADLLVIESNHDEGMLRAGPYPPSVQARIASRTGHLSNRGCADLVRGVVHRDLAHVILAHLSEQCNDHGLAHRTTADALRRTRYRGALSVAMQHDVVGPFRPRAGRGEPDAQYALAF
jgi:phosphoribosyl 1,2-cyclic phosphodiesterase